MGAFCPKQEQLNARSSREGEAAQPLTLSALKRWPINNQFEQRMTVSRTPMVKYRQYLCGNVCHIGAKVRIKSANCHSRKPGIVWLVASGFAIVLHAGVRDKLYPLHMQGAIHPSRGVRCRLIAQASIASENAALPQKSDRHLLHGTQWFRGEPLPHCLHGFVAETLCGRVERLISARGAVVRLLWEGTGRPAASVPSSWKPKLEKSPLTGLLDMHALTDAFGLPYQTSNFSLRQLFFQEQAVNVRIETGTGELMKEGLLKLTLAKEQPLESPQALPPTDVPSTLSQWAQCLSKHYCRVDGQFDAATAQLPPASWNDKMWASKLADVREFQNGGPCVEMMNVVFPSWALAESGRDLVVAAPLTPRERALLYFLPLLWHLRAQPLPVKGSRPQVLVLCQLSVGHYLGPWLANARGIRMGQKTRARKGSSRVLLGPLDAVLAEAKQRPGLLKRISYLVIDNLFALARHHQQELQELLGLLPTHLWGPSLIWTPKWPSGLEATAAAYVDAPLILRGSDCVWGPEHMVDMLSFDELHRRVASYVHRYPSFRFAIFSELPEVMQEELAKSGLASDVPSANSSGRVVVVRSQEQWAAGNIVDVVLHAHPPPNRSEYHRRLACCKRLAVHVLAWKGVGDNRTLTSPAWWSFARYARGDSSAAHSQEVWTLLHRTRNVTERRSELPELMESVQQATQGGGDTANDFIKIQKDGPPVWAAGVNLDEDEFGDEPWL